MHTDRAGDVAGQALAAVGARPRPLATAPPLAAWPAAAGVGWRGDAKQPPESRLNRAAAGCPGRLEHVLLRGLGVQRALLAICVARKVAVAVAGSAATVRLLLLLQLMELLRQGGLLVAVAGAAVAGRRWAVCCRLSPPPRRGRLRRLPARQRPLHASCGRRTRPLARPRRLAAQISERDAGAGQLKGSLSVKGAYETRESEAGLCMGPPPPPYQRGGVPNVGAARRGGDRRRRSVGGRMP